MIYEVAYMYDEGYVPQEDSMRVAQLHAEMDLWATRLKMAKAAHALAESLVNEVEKYDYSKWWWDEVCERAWKWEHAVAKIKSKYEKAKIAYENYFTELKIH